MKWLHDNTGRKGYSFTQDIKMRVIMAENEDTIAADYFYRTDGAIKLGLPYPTVQDILDMVEARKTR